MIKKNQILLLGIVSIIFINFIVVVDGALPKLFSSSKSSSVTITTTTINSNFTNFTQLLDSGFTSYTGLNDLCLVVNETLGKIQARSCSSGSGDITAVNTLGVYLFGGVSTGDANLNLNETRLNQTINNLIDNDELHYNQTTPAIDHYKSNPASYYNVTTLPASSGNASWNQSLANSLYQAIGSYLLVSDLPLTNRTRSHWDNVTNKPANLDIDSTNDLLITDLPLHNRTLVNCLNITGADADFCNDATGGSSYKGDGIYLYNDSTTMYFNQTKENITINSLIDLDELHYNSSIPDQSYTDTRTGTANLHLHSLLNITGIDDNVCGAGDFVSNVTFDNGNLKIVCTTPSAGAGDITSVQGDIYIINGSNSGAVNLLFNETKLNNTIDDRSINVETDPIFSANFTNMQTDCPTGNYTYGVLGNGTLKCRSDTTGSGVADFTNVAYVNNTQTFTGQNTFRNNITFKDWNNQAVLGTFLASNTTAWYWSFGNPTGEFGEGNYFKINDTGIYDGTTLVRGEFVYNHTTISNSYTDTRVTTNNLHKHDLLNLTGVDDNACTGTDKVSNVTINNGVLTIVCTADVSGAGGGFTTNQIDNNLNQTANVSFSRITLNRNNSDYDQIQFVNESGSVKLTISSEPTDNYLIGGLTQTSGIFSSDFIYPFTSVATIGTASSRFITIFGTNITATDTLNTSKICLGNDCRTSWNAVSNLTNVAFYNNTQTWTANQTLNSSIIMKNSTFIYYGTENQVSSGWNGTCYVITGPTTKSSFC